MWFSKRMDTNIGPNNELEPQVTQSSIFTKLKNILSTRTYIILIVIVVLTFSILLNVLFIANRGEKEEEKITPEITAPTNTYNNGIFSFSYDARSRIELDDADQLYIGNSNLVEKKVDNGREYVAKDNERYFSLEIYPSTDACPTTESDLEDPKVSSVSIASQTVRVLEGKAPFDQYRKSICLTKDEKLYYFLNEYQNNAGEQVKKESRRLFDQIIQSFKFSDSKAVDEVFGERYTSPLGFSFVNPYNQAPFEKTYNLRAKNAEQLFVSTTNNSKVTVVELYRRTTSDPIVVIEAIRIQNIGDLTNDSSSNKYVYSLFTPQDFSIGAYTAIDNKAIFNETLYVIENGRLSSSSPFLQKNTYVSKGNFRKYYNKTYENERLRGIVINEIGGTTFPRDAQTAYILVDRKNKLFFKVTGFDFGCEIFRQHRSRFATEKDAANIQEYEKDFIQSLTACENRELESIINTIWVD